jgi:6-pyruvoyltetrahydropterin/6-carboxytetrahydropterin synthase
MTCEVGVVARFRARHHLVGDFGPASAPHEHAYRVVANVRGGGLQSDGTLLDITALQRALGEALAALEGLDLNAVAQLAKPNPTAEVLAHYLFDRVAPALSSAPIDALTLAVWESDEAYASYTGDLATWRR